MAEVEEISDALRSSVDKVSEKEKAVAKREAAVEGDKPRAGLGIQLGQRRGQWQHEHVSVISEFKLVSG